MVWPWTADWNHEFGQYSLFSYKLHFQFHGTFNYCRIISVFYFNLVVYGISLKKKKWYIKGLDLITPHFLCFNLYLIFIFFFFYLSFLFVLLYLLILFIFLHYFIRWSWISSANNIFDVLISFLIRYWIRSNQMGTPLNEPNRFLTYEPNRFLTEH